ncbi:Spermidine/putrescine-binding periplasmic protein [Microbacterium sp. C448]|nr:Spermidine/putrescine-binding periplasmic protein [Microbacterium sp. C448]
MSRHPGTTVGPVERSLETQVSGAVDAWLRWLPRWEPSTHRGRVAPCRRCFGSPVLSAAGLGSDVPHAVQHGLSTRIKAIVDQAVAVYTSLNLPMLQAELDQQAARNRARSYRPAEGLEPEYEGLPMDPDPVAGAPFLFTISGLAQEVDAEVPALPALTDAAKAALRQEVGLADDYANLIGREVCAILLHHRLRIQAAVTRYVEPQVDALLAELSQSLDAPFDPGMPPFPAPGPDA